MITRYVTFITINGPRRAVDQFSVGPVRESSSPVLCVFIHVDLKRTPVHLEIRLAEYARARTLVRLLAFQGGMEGCRYVYS